MTSRRSLKAAEAIREVVSMAILTELQDPRVQDVTVTHVVVPADLRSAKVHVSVMGDEKKQQLCLHGLRSSAGFLQRCVAQRIDIRYTPRLEFVLDEGVKKSLRIAKILQDVKSELDTTSPPTTDDGVPYSEQETFDGPSDMGRRTDRSPPSGDQAADSN